MSVTERSAIATHRIQFLDALRGLAAVAVMLHHYNQQLHWRALEYGNLGVPMFFVLSGFVIAMSVGSRPPVSLSYLGRFALRRAVRLDPPYWLSMFAVLAIGYVGAQYGIKYESASAGQVLAHMVYLQAWFDYESIQVIYWTLCYEVQFYLLLIVLLWARLPIGWILVATLALSILDRHAEISGPAFMGRFWFCFALGALTFYCSRFVIRRQAFFVAPLVTVAAFGAIYRDGYAITAAVTALAIYSVIAFDARKLGSSAPLQFLGRISYSLYLTHLIFGWLALRVAQSFMPTPVAVLVGIVVALGAAWVFCVLVERPAVQISKLVELVPPSTGRLAADKAGGWS